jgi:hypothetical protein
MGKWFHLDLDGHQKSTVMASNGLGFVQSSHPPSTEQTRFVQVDRIGRNCCGCCGCFANCFARESDEWEGLDGRLRGRGINATVAIGGLFFVVAVLAMVVLILVVWSLDSFEDVVGSVEQMDDVGSGSGI